MTCPDEEVGELWDEVPDISPEFTAEMRRLGDIAADLYYWLYESGLVC